MKKIILLSLLTFIIFPIFSAATVTGRVLDSISQRPIEFVTVTVHNLNTDKTIGGALTNQDGVFNIASVQDGTYELRISFVGYNPYKKEFSVNGSQVRLGDIFVVENTTVLQEVQVVGQGSQMRFDIDKRVFSVDQNIASAGGSATDVLENIPSVSVDNDGNISLRNNSSVEIWINGKPSGLTAENRAQILQQMPAENLESIEIMTNPSAKFNPEGKAGIINLVMKKNRKAGYYGSVSAGTTLESGKLGYNTGASINYNVGKFDTYANVGIRRNSGVGKGFSERKNFQNGDTTLLTQTSRSDYSRNGVFFRSGIDYHLNQKNTIGIGGTGFFGMPNTESHTDYLFEDIVNVSVLRDYSRDNKSSGNYGGYSLNLFHKIEFDKLGTNLITDIIYSNHNFGSSQRFTQREKASDIDQLDNSQKSDAGMNGIEIKSDFTKKFNENNRLELGWSSRLNNRVSESSGFDYLKNAEITEYFNHFDYSEQTHALYATYGTRIKNFSVQGGLRGEYFKSNSTSTPSDYLKPISKEYFELFPSVYLSYSLPANSEIQLNYSRRIDRPRGWYINPFKDYSDSTNISYGNPDLNPEFESSFELNYIKNWDNHTISTSVYYKFDTDDIERVSFMNNGVMESTYMNLLKDNNLGVEFISRNQLFRILNLTTTLNAYYNRLNATTYTSPYDPSIVVQIPEAQNFSWESRVMANIMFTPTFTAQITGDYRSLQIQPLSERYPRFSMDLGLRKTFLDRKLSLSFNVRDLLNTRIYKGKSWGEGFTQYYENSRRGRMFGLTLTYNFGNMRPTKPAERPNNMNNRDMDDEGGGMGGMP